MDKEGYGCVMAKDCEYTRNIRRTMKVQIALDIIIYHCVAFPVLFLFLQGTPYLRGFFCDDVSLSYPYRPDTISTTMLILAGFSTSVVLIVMTEVLICVDSKCRRMCPSADDMLYCVKSYAIFLAGFIVQQLVVEVVKNKMGVLRPNFIDVCKPYYNTTTCPGYIIDYTCTAEHYNADEIRTSRQSFPSGHSSLSMYIAVYFCMYIEKRLQIRFSRILKFFLQSGLVFTALLCGLGRIIDNKHHPCDVIAGFVLGAVIAVFVHHTIGRETFGSDKSNCSDKLSYNSWDCNACASSPETEPHTPSPLLPNEYSSAVSDGQTTRTTPKLKDIPFYVRRHFSTPITPTNRSEEVV